MVIMMELSLSRPPLEAGRHAKRFTNINPHNPMKWVLSILFLCLFYR